MSGIYILNSLKEYRVAYSNLFLELNGSYNKSLEFEVVPEIAQKMFGDSKVFDSYDLAIDYAKELSRALPETEDGIFVISDFNKVSFEDLINGNTNS